MTQNTTSAPVEISRTNAKFMEAFRRGDAAGLAAVYTGNARIFPPNTPARSGREAIQEFWQGALDMGVADVQLETLEFQQQGDTGWESGRATLKTRDGALLDTLQYIVVWEKENGEWKWHRDIWNSSRTSSS
jgi:ketosteroid isomerase-like protein